MWGRQNEIKTGVLRRSAGAGAFAPACPEAAPAGARVLAVASGKGGVGKSNLTVNLGLALAALEQRVIILDADLGLANVEVLLGVTPPVNLFDCLYRGRDIHDALVPAPGGVRFISGGSGFLELANLDQQRRSQLVASLAQLDGEADFLLIDTGAGISKNVLAFLAAAGEVIVVITPEPTSLTDGYALIKVLSRFRSHREVLLAVSRAAGGAEARETARRVEAAAGRFLDIGVRYLGAIYEDRAVNRAVRAQRPFMLAEPRSRPARAVADMAGQLLTGRREEAAVRRPGINGFFSRLARAFG
ncbi:MinD/ParA family protein [Desulfotomaculum copahuensis]|uniref:ATPase n=1 Tax=Desulfotomaculum copahuensis TaxID=1838280 RepID=A0A1B7LBN0_9FIRM|nr:MinD/ParA family protein [Desulfotomaculum copahuensis]OAT79921.1 ATPase [Desulfotomaculum copahuensis]